MRRLDRVTLERVKSALDRLADEAANAKIKKLKGRPDFSLRVGDWRVLIALRHSEDVIDVLRVRPRGKAYE
jgi:mRNA-degrading endonuclease RelE of RelBE toxin-antitoxin system